VFLKSLTLRGFKSFAEKTALEFEPGITVIVGPNGSGKSNIVDALSWVLGTHSAKSMRGGSMSDVIFAGSAGKSALGRAAVEISIDNASQTLPIDFTEVTVGRTIFASGENTYGINGVDCRALDVQELLSDTGLGREHHTIVGQGQLDAVLNAKPEDRRAFIEEAAGILKHRKRKERALRKLAQMEGHVERLTDLLRELRRNLRPLERQAEAAAKHAELQRTLREVRVLRAVRELDELSRRWDSEASAQAASDVRMTDLDAAMAAARGEESAVEQELSRLTPAVRAAGETHFRLANLVERYRGLSDRIAERRKGLVEAVEEPIAGRDPEELRGRARQEQGVLDDLAAEHETARAALQRAEEARRGAEQARRAHEQAAAAEARRRAQAREQQLRWEGEVSALRSSLAQAASEEGRLSSQLSGLEARRAELQADVTSVTNEIQRLDTQEGPLGERLAAAEALVTKRQDAADAAAKTERELERQRASLEARADALRAASAEAGEGTSALLEAAEQGVVADVVGPLADHVSVVDGMAKAVAAALGPLGDAVVVASRRGAQDAVTFVREQRSGRVLLLADARGDDAEDVADAARDRELADLGARPLVEALRAAPGILAALRRALAGVYAIEDFAAACRLAARFPQCVFVSVAGEVAGPRGYAGGSTGVSSAVLSRAAAEQAEAQLETTNAELLVAHRKLGDADRDLKAARHELDAATAAMQESDGLITAAAERLNRLNKELATCERELGVLVGQQADLAREIEGQRQRLESLEARGPESVELDPRFDHDGPDLEAERLDDALTEAREQEVQARLAASALEQRGAELARRIEALRSEADDVERQLEERERRRVARLAAIERCGELAIVAADALQQAERSLAVAAEERDRIEEARSEQQRTLGVVRARIRDLEEQIGALRESRHAEELRRAELRHAVDAVRARLRDELGIVDSDALLMSARASSDPETDARAAAAVSADEMADPDASPAAAATAVEDADVEITPSAAARAWGGGDPLAGGQERDDALAEEEDRLVKKVGLLGTVNPLALEEFTAMEERHRFLSEQLDDLRQSRNDLLKVVEAVDARIREVFAAAFVDVAAQFETIFPRLFPGGEGRLILTDPDDMLNTGVEVEARPPGKRVKRLSLLSGGERSLTALAVLFAIFAARPSPFYVLDEVEAALDDVNLQRFLDVVKDFRASSQLIIVTHQKRTMEIADMLYGISMQRNGVSKVISQRMHAEASAAAQV
jgi:chromosome segregation protein